MPDKSAESLPERPRRGRGFGGSLIGMPSRLPEDDDEPEAPAPAAIPDRTLAEPEPAPEPAAPPRRPATKRATAPRGRRRESAPQTVRLSGPASSALWDGYLAAKEEDPFLTYVDYASGIVTDGLARDARRRSR